MGLFNRQRPTIGFDIGSSSIKLMELEHGKDGRHRLKHFAMAQLPPEANVQFMTIMATKMPYIGRG